jgi:hypothetical protein
LRKVIGSLEKLDEKTDEMQLDFSVVLDNDQNPEASFVRKLIRERIHTPAFVPRCDSETEEN